MENLIGTALDERYLIQSIVGIGGMSVVYKALDQEKGATVAIKILKDEYRADDHFRRRFSIESQAIAILNHPNIVSVYDVSFKGDMPYLVMEHIEGITLKKYLCHQERLNWKVAVYFIGQILEALEHAHENGVVHRDIKPQNIMVLQDGRIKVTDFGIARFASSETKTMTDRAIGSVHYISPEQASGSHTDERSDLYSVGVMLYELVTGALPFESDNAVSVAIMHLKSQPKHPRELVSEIPEGLADIILKAMAKEPYLRYQTASEMLRDLNDLKMNPTMQFEYKYLTKESPTQFFDVVTGERQESIESENDEGNIPRSKKPVIVGILAAVVAVFVVIIVSINTLSPGTIGFGDRNPDIEVPDVIGRNIDMVLAEYDETFTIHQNPEEYNDEFAKGEIIDQSPHGGMTVKKAGASFRVTVSLGKRLVQVYDVRNMTAKEAANQLEKDGLQIKVEREKHETVELDHVIRTDPEADEEIAYEDTVTLYVSDGPEIVMVEVPSIVDKMQDDAKEELANAKLVGNVIPKESERPVGTVLNQNPNAGIQVVEGTVVEYEVSTGVAKLSKTFYLTLPKDLQFYHVRVLRNGEVVYDRNHVYEDSPLNFSFDGKKGDSDYFEFYVNDILEASEQVVFS